MSKSNGPMVSVIIVNFRGADDTIVCVQQLAAVEWPTSDLEIIVVENGSGDDSAERLQAALGSLPNFRLVASEQNLGFTGGSNLGAKSAKGQYLAFLNNDSKPDTGWIANALREFDSSPTVAAVASKVLDWAGERVDFDGGSLTWFGMGYKDRVNEFAAEVDSHPTDLLFGTGSALFVKSEIFAEVGGFDENLFMFYDDVDLGWRLNLLGYRVRYAPASVVYHKHHGSMKTFGPHREMFLLERNALILLYKNLADENLYQFLAGALALAGRRAATKSGLDLKEFDLRGFRGDAAEFDPSISVNKESAAVLLAVDQFVELLPELSKERERVQSTRRRTDQDVFRLFGDMFKSLFDAPHFERGKIFIEQALSISDTGRRNRVLVITGDAVGERMAGPAMRAWKIAEILSAENDVHLVSWNSASRTSREFAVSKVRLNNERDMRALEQWADVIIFQGHALHHFKTLQKSNKVMVADIYDPMHLEQLEQGREHGTLQWTNQVSSSNAVLNQQLKRADFFLCASDRQRMFWLGQLAGLGRVNPANYAADESLDSLIAIAPFGMDSAPPRHTRKAIRGVVPGIGENDKLVIWGGGIYNWFDTVTLLHSIREVADRHPNIRLFFMGVKHPNPDVPEMAIVARTRELAARLGLADKHVFFNENWVALDDRQNYLLEADAGVSTHYVHVETTFSFRTRILDYLWASLPIVTTEGDSFGDIVETKGIGLSVPERDVRALASALERALYDDDFRSQVAIKMPDVREEFTWERALAPLVEFVRDPRPAADRAVSALLQADVANSVTQHGTQDTLQARLMAASERNMGLRRDLALARIYVSEGGPRMLIQKVRERMAFMRRRRA